MKYHHCIFSVCDYRKLFRLPTKIHLHDPPTLHISLALNPNSSLHYTALKIRNCSRFLDWTAPAKAQSSPKQYPKRFQKTLFF